MRPPARRALPVWSVVLGAFLVLLVGAGVQTCRAVSLERALTAAKLEPQARAVEIAAAKVDTVKVQLAGKEKIVRKVITRVRVDTLMLAPQSVQDTLRALTQLPVLAAAHDSLQRTCSAFVVACTDYRAAAESRDTAQQLRIRGLEDALHGARPSRLGAIWNRTKVPLAFAGGFYLAHLVK